MSAEHLTSTVLEVLRRAPAWVRSDLASQDQALRQRAEEVLTTMITAALAGAGEQLEG